MFLRQVNASFLRFIYLSIKINNDKLFQVSIYPNPNVSTGLREQAELKCGKAQAFSMFFC